MDTPDASLPSYRAPFTRALRLTFAYRGNAIRLIDSRPVEAIAPPVVTPLPQQGQTGYLLQVTDAAGRVIYHRPLHNPIAVDVEAFSPDRRQTITRVPIADPQGQFSVLMPDVPEAVNFALLGPADARAPDEPARELIRLDVNELRKFRPKDTGPSGSERPKGN